MLENAPICPHCGKETEKYDVYPWDGVSWGVPFLYVCFNDECQLYVKGQKHMLETYGQVASYRYMVYPDTGQEDTMVAVNPRHMEARVAASPIQIDSEDLKE
ncbi:MAG: hypothetical protein HY754_05555 [Nitrospirae bacterium]|nr:hypothetical protein [Nitrospirota bacterium]